LHDSWQCWALVYQELKGRTWNQPLWQLARHMVNHGTHHRGQVSGFLGAVGHALPPLDLVFYYREPMGSA